MNSASQMNASTVVSYALRNLVAAEHNILAGSSCIARNHWIHPECLFEACLQIDHAIQRSCRECGIFVRQDSLDFLTQSRLPPRILGQMIEATDDSRRGLELNGEPKFINLKWAKQIEQLLRYPRQPAAYQRP